MLQLGGAFLRTAHFDVSDVSRDTDVQWAIFTAGGMGVGKGYAMRWLRGWSRREPWTHAAANPDGRPKPFFVYKSYTVPHAGGWGNSNEDGAPVPDQGVFAKETSWPEVERDHAAVIFYLDGLVGQLVGVLKVRRRRSSN